MNIQVTELLKSLETVTPGLDAREDIQQGNCFIFSQGRVFTYNDEIFISCKSIDFKTEPFAVNAPAFLGLLRKFSNKEVTIKLVQKELILKCGNTKSGLRIQDLESVALSAVEMPEKWQKAPADMVDALLFCVPCIGSDMTKAVLTFAHVTGQYVETTDGFRFTRRFLKTKNKGLDKKNILVPSIAIKALKGYTPSHYGKTSGWLHFKMDDGLILSCRTNQEDYPSVDHFIGLKGKTIQMPDDILDSLDRTSVFVEGKTDSQKIAQFHLSKKKSIVSAKTTEGWIEEKIKTTYKGPDIRFVANPFFMADLLSLTNTFRFCGNTLEFSNADFVHVLCVMAVADSSSSTEEEDQIPF